ncbi:hypothetical protein K7462_30680, partial [Pseudomonas fluorescens]|nr:hypothetical protein [Pseudomonas fluorescens]
LLRMPYRISFAYAGLDAKWGGRWLETGELPTAVRFDIRDVERGTVISSAARIHVERGAPRADPSTIQQEEAQPQANDGPT